MALQKAALLQLTETAEGATITLDRPVAIGTLLRLPDGRTVRVREEVGAKVAKKKTTKRKNPADVTQCALRGIRSQQRALWQALADHSQEFQRLRQRIERLEDKL